MRTILIDDDYQSRRALKLILGNCCPDIEIVGECNNAAEALEMVVLHNPSLCFLDVHMPGKNGIDFIRDLKGGNFEVIFVTAHEKYAIQALRLAAADYLLKPVDPVKLADAVHKVKNRLTRRSM
jgi:two-component system LytT family response regulator